MKHTGNELQNSQYHITLCCHHTFIFTPYIFNVIGLLTPTEFRLRLAFQIYLHLSICTLTCFGFDLTDPALTIWERVWEILEYQNTQKIKIGLGILHIYVNIRLQVTEGKFCIVFIFLFSSSRSKIISSGEPPLPTKAVNPKFKDCNWL